MAEAAFRQEKWTEVTMQVAKLLDAQSCDLLLRVSADECRSSHCLAPKPAGVPAKFRKQVAASVRAFVPP